MSEHPDDARLIGQIRQHLERDLPDADTRAALQQARIRALAAHNGRSRRAPWLGFAVAASLLAVVLVKLPNTGTDASRLLANQDGPAKSTPAVATDTASKPAANTPTAGKTAGKPTAAAGKPTSPAPDLDLLENLELYEDTEFYEWLSEQDGQGGLDA